MEMGFFLGGAMLEELRETKLEGPRQRCRKKTRGKAETAQEREKGRCSNNSANREEEI